MVYVIDIIFTTLRTVIQLIIFGLILFFLLKLFKIEKNKLIYSFFISLVLFVPSYLLYLLHPFLGNLFALLYLIIVGISIIKKIYDINWKKTLLVWFLWMFIVYFLLYLYSLFIAYLRPI